MDMKKLNKKETANILKTKTLFLLHAGTETVEQIMQACEDKSVNLFVGANTTRYRYYKRGQTNLEFEYLDKNLKTSSAFLDIKPIKNSVLIPITEAKLKIDFKDILIIFDKDSDLKTSYLVSRRK